MKYNSPFKMIYDKLGMACNEVCFMLVYAGWQQEEQGGRGAASVAGGHEEKVGEARAQWAKRVH